MCLWILSTWNTCRKNTLIFRYFNVKMTRLGQNNFKLMEDWRGKWRLKVLTTFRAKMLPREDTAHVQPITNTKMKRPERSERGLRCRLLKDLWQTTGILPVMPLCTISIVSRCCTFSQELKLKIFSKFGF